MTNNQYTNNDDKIKHLEFIQNNIARMANNSFQLKGWNIGIISALLFFGEKAQNRYVMILCLLPTLMFWILDSYFLKQEKLYRNLFDEVRLDGNTTSNPDVYLKFNMNASTLEDNKTNHLSVFFSKTLMIFYVLLIITIVLLICLA